MGQHVNELCDASAACRMSQSAHTLAISKHCPHELKPKGSGWCLNDFVLVKKLGVGGASAVYQAIHRRSRACVALKLYFKSKMTALNTHQVQREVSIHSRLHHPNIIALVCSHCAPSLTS
jgi:serine/threonine protein kinase